jgi:gamma-glutamyltranspeptidase
VTNVLARYIGQRASLEKATQYPRIHTEGDVFLTVETKFQNTQQFESFGYKVSKSSVGSFNAIERDQSGNTSSSKR